MFKVGHIYYFADFKFKDGGSKPKYFIVLSETKNGVIIGTLPTRTIKVASFIDKEHGCINIEERMFNCYLFKKGQPVCQNGFSFDLPTFIYGNDIDYYPKDKLEAEHPVEGKHYKCEGELTPEEFKNLIDCVKNSGAVKRGIRNKI